MPTLLGVMKSRFWVRVINASFNIYEFWRPRLTIVNSELPIFYRVEMQNSDWRTSERARLPTWRISLDERV
jgi:hypothetical protein